MRSYIVTWAQSATRVHKVFWASLQSFVRHNQAELIVVGGRYRNPTSKAEASRSGDEVWADEVMPYLVRKRRVLAPSLRLYADISIQPTAGRPLSGFEVFLGSMSGVFGHPKRAFEVVPTSTRQPRAMWTTGACTVRHYSDSKAGKKGSAHHVLGALVVEVDDDGIYFARHVTAAKDGSFTDLGDVYSPAGVSRAPRALSVTLGDIHVGMEDDAVLEASEALVRQARPKHLVLHDVLDFDARSHHRARSRDRYGRRFDQVEYEVAAAMTALNRFATWGADQVDVVASNHHEHLRRWLDEHRSDQDPVNTPYWHRLWAACYEAYAKTGEWPDEFALEAQRLGCDKRIKFLSRGSSLKLAGVEHGQHGDSGVNGSRGSIAGLSRLGCKLTIGHSHTPGIRDGVFQVGVSGRLDMGYNSLPSTWLHAHVVLHADGKRQLVVITKGRFKGARLSAVRRAA